MKQNKNLVVIATILSTLITSVTFSNFIYSKDKVAKESKTIEKIKAIMEKENNYVTTNDKKLQKLCDPLGIYGSKETYFLDPEMYANEFDVIQERCKEALRRNGKKKPYLFDQYQDGPRLRELRRN